MAKRLKIIGGKRPEQIDSIAEFKYVKKQDGKLCNKTVELDR